MFFPERLKSIRGLSCYKQREVAQYLNIDIRTYQGYEEGRSEPNIARLIALADFFDVTLDYLMGRTDA